MMSLPAILALIDAGELDGRIPSPSVETAILGQPKPDEPEPKRL